jgi:hypothetical protein
MQQEHRLKCKFLYPGLIAAIAPNSLERPSLNLFSLCLYFSCFASEKAEGGTTGVSSFRNGFIEPVR